MVDPDWIPILGKQRLPCVKGNVTCIRNVSVLQKKMLFACHRSQISGSVLGSIVHSFNKKHIKITKNLRPLGIHLKCFFPWSVSKNHGSNFIFLTSTLFACPQKQTIFEVFCCLHGSSMFIGSELSKKSNKE